MLVEITSHKQMIYPLLRGTTKHTKVFIYASKEPTPNKVSMN